MNIKHNIWGGLLAGGLATRMGYVNKGALIAGRHSLAHFAINRLQQQVNNVLISANDYLDFYSSFGTPVYKDERPNHPGPLAGIETLLSHLQVEWLFCVPVDVPVYPINTLSRLYESAISANSLCSYPANESKDQPLFCLIHKSLLANLNYYLNNGNHKVSKWLAENKACKVALKTETQDFVNINTPEDLREFSKFITEHDETEFKNA